MVDHQNVEANLGQKFAAKSFISDVGPRLPAAHPGPGIEDFGGSNGLE